MTDFQAALGLSQLSGIDEFVNRRHHLAGCYDRAFRNTAFVAVQQCTDVWSAHHLYIIRLPLERIGKSRRGVFEELREKG